MRLPRFSLAMLVVALACAPKQPARKAASPRKAAAEAEHRSRPGPRRSGENPEGRAGRHDAPMVPPETAYAHGWMPLASTGVEEFLRLTRHMMAGAC